MRDGRLGGKRAKVISRPHVDFELRGEDPPGPRRHRTRKGQVAIQMEISTEPDRELGL